MTAIIQASTAWRNRGMTQMFGELRFCPRNDPRAVAKACSEDVAKPRLAAMQHNERPSRLSTAAPSPETPPPKRMRSINGR
ncbi:hypothetical protein BFN67_06850 [Pseudaminobacter manganicus]|uniref:Uncharacterized protein n=1 Tax=Manganibacter manganicus TaxID=1873176 RepID=A0A1V8RKB5_9HYPH|nr:hypothetical protein BFN67_06850 [Pseudaminobacter manganicus]